MRYYDFHVHSGFSEGESSIEEIATRAKLLGFKGICFSEYYKNKERIEQQKDQIIRIGQNIGLDILIGFEARNSWELKKLMKTRREYDVLMVRGHDLNLNRKAVETPEVDILTHPEFGRKDSGFNHIMAKLAADNNVAIELNFREILLSTKYSRSHVLHNITQNMVLCKKYHAPIIICSGAISHWQLRDPMILASMGVLLGLDLGEAKLAVSKVPESILKMIRERRSEKWIMPGVKVV